MNFEEIIYEKKDGVARIAINRPEKYNACTSLTLLELNKALTDAWVDTSVGVVVFTGTGEKAFCTGGDQSIRNKSGYAGTIAALMIRFKEYRLPRAQRLLEKVNAGEKLSDYDIRFLKRIYNDSRNSQPLLKRHPEYNELIARALNLYTEIIAKGLENEESG